MKPSDLFENNGYYWDIFDAETHKFYGIFGASEYYTPHVEFGFKGKIEKLTKEIVIQKGATFYFKSFKKPRKIWYMLNMNCGKLKNPINKL